MTVPSGWVRLPPHPALQRITPERMAALGRWHVSPQRDGSLLVQPDAGADDVGLHVSLLAEGAGFSRDTADRMLSWPSQDDVLTSPEMQVLIQLRRAEQALREQEPPAWARFAGEVLTATSGE